MNPHHTLLSLLLALGLSGCAAKSLSTTPTPTSAARPAATTPEASTANRAEDSRSHPDETSEALEAAPIYFTLDSATLTPEAQDRLERLARALRQRPDSRVTVSGHTCELGTTEYNLALGQRRADIIRTYLARLGVERQRIAVVSYGEERPAEEESVEKNRRAEFSFRLSEQAQAGAR
ncbi:OmpA family protein [Archangium violaceum]|uniref:OmpA family protein n=1 Tax=Archangium violaceum TaxID=83451 RepID=UPI00193B9258|nr:OmpA family protein [Archangium violaceum]QRK04775.1 OmpA family protein [Archangium violaceum]